MIVLGLSVVVIGLAMGGMALGLAFGRGPMGRGCGDAAACEACTGRCARRAAAEEDTTWTSP